MPAAVQVSDPVSSARSACVGSGRRLFEADQFLPVPICRAPASPAPGFAYLLAIRSRRLRRDGARSRIAGLWTRPVEQLGLMFPQRIAEPERRAWADVAVRRRKSAFFDVIIKC